MLHLLKKTIANPDCGAILPAMELSRKCFKGLERMSADLESYEDCLEYCTQQGMRLSKQRQLILRLLWDTDEHLSAQEIYDRLTQQREKIGHTSVYQNLDALVQVGAIEQRLG